MLKSIRSGGKHDSTIIRSTCHYNDDIYHIELSNIADCSVTRHKHKQYAPIESIVDSKHHLHISVDCVARMEFAMNDYLIEWLNMKIDESLHTNNLTDYEMFVKLKEREEEK